MCDDVTSGSVHPDVWIDPSQPTSWYSPLGGLTYTPYTRVAVTTCDVTNCVILQWLVTNNQNLKVNFPPQQWKVFQNAF